ncbi:Regulator of G-protein signaling 12, partial [Galemys pyrenaicus]
RVCCGQQPAQTRPDAGRVQQSLAPGAAAGQHYPRRTPRRAASVPGPGQPGRDPPALGAAPKRSRLRRRGRPQEPLPAELSGADLKDCVSSHSLSSNASLPSVQSCRRLRERRVASWAVSFERLLQDPLGVRYFSDFLRKEFSEENILFWQACEHLHHVPAHDQKELSHRAREIFSRFLCSKATTPVNIDSQAQLADDSLSAPHPDMFKEQQLQIFNLMKFDSYTRFLKSPLYQECILAEVEGRPLPDARQVPGSPASKHSVGSDHSNTSTPKKLSGKSRSGRSLNEDPGDEDGERRRKGAFFSWSRTRSTGRSQKKKGHGDQAKDAPQANGGLGRRESQGSVSSAGSLDLPEAGRTLAPERDKAAKHCRVQLPDGASCAVPLRPGLSVKEVLAGLCERHGLNGAAVDLFLVGGDKPLVLHQDSSVLESRDLRLEKRTLFRLDLVPINRSVGLKAKPTKPVTEVLRPVVAKYGLHLSELVVRLSGEKEPLDLGAPIASLDGQRVILEERDPSRGKDKQKSAASKPSAGASSRAHAAAGEERTLGKSNSIKIKGENGKHAREPRLSKREDSIAKIGGKKYQKINLDEAEGTCAFCDSVLGSERCVLGLSGREPAASQCAAEGPALLPAEFFELISKAQSSRADDQRGLLRKEDLELPEFLRLPTCAPAPAQPLGSGAAAPGHLQSPAASPSPGTSPGSAASLPGQKAPFCAPLSPGSHEQDAETGVIQTMAGGNEADLTLTGEGDISSPSSTLLLPPPTPQDAAGPPRPGLSSTGRAPGLLLGPQARTGPGGSGAGGAVASGDPTVRMGGVVFPPASPQARSAACSLVLVGLPAGGGARGSQGLPVSAIIDVDSIAAPGPGWGVWTGPWRVQARRPPTSEPRGSSPGARGPTTPRAGPHHATFV